MANEKRFIVGDRFGREMTLVAFGETVALATRLYDAADNESGLLSPAQMLEFFPGMPEHHTETTLSVALLAAGCAHVGDTQDGQL